MASIYDWSLLAANNANADADVNWAEGQPPASVNNSARFMMQRIKEMLSDFGATATAGGSANVLTFMAKSAVAVYADGIRVTIKAAADNTGAATLNVNSVGAKPIVKFTIDGETAMAAGEIQAGAIYDLVYSTALNGGAGGWLILNPTVRPQVHAGAVMINTMPTAPTGWLECNGAALSRTTYSALFAYIGTTWGVGDGSTTFNIPDFRGFFLRGWDNGRGVDTGRVFASFQADAFAEHGHGVNDPGHLHTQQGSGTPGGGNTAQYSGALTTAAPQGTATVSAVTGITIQNNGGAETRPRNNAVLFIIKT